MPVIQACMDENISIFRRENPGKDVTPGIISGFRKSCSEGVEEIKESITETVDNIIDPIVNKQKEESTSKFPSLLIIGVIFGSILLMFSFIPTLLLYLGVLILIFFAGSFIPGTKNLVIPMLSNLSIIGIGSFILYVLINLVISGFRGIF